MMEEGRSYNPGDRNGRTIHADEIALMWDGNMIGAIAGPDLVEGVPAYAETVHDALRELAENLVSEAVRVEIPDERRALSGIRQVENTTLCSDFVALYRVDESRVCALIEADDSDEGIWGFGPSVQDAVRDLAAHLVQRAVWIEVKAEAIWTFMDVDSLPGPQQEEDEDT